MPKHFWLHPLAQAIALALPATSLMPMAAQADLTQTLTSSPVVSSSSRVTTIDAQQKIKAGTPDNHPASINFPLFSAKSGVLTGVQVDFTHLILDRKVSLAAQWADKAGQVGAIALISFISPLITLEFPSGVTRTFLGSKSQLQVECNLSKGLLCPQTTSLVSVDSIQRADLLPLDAYVGEGGTVIAALDSSFYPPEQLLNPPLNTLNSATLTETVNKLGGTIGLSYSYLNHAQPAFTNTKLQTATVDFGTVLQGANVGSQKWGLRNDGAAPNVGLDLTGIATNDPAAFLFDLGLTGGLISGLGAGQAHDFLASIDTAQPGISSATYQFQLADSALGALASRQNYTASLTFTADIKVREPFVNPTSFPVGFHPAAPVVTDLNRDGKPDLVLLDRDHKNLVVYAGLAHGGFDHKVASQTLVGNNPVTLAVGDIDNNGHPDVVVANYDDNTVSVLRGNGGFSFQPATTVAAGAGPIAVSLNDLNRDGKLDLVIADTRVNRVRIRPGLGDGTFGSAANFASGSLPYGLVVADINRDGKLDVAVTNPTTNRINVLQGNGDGSLQTRRSFNVGNNPLSLTSADVDGDGKPDLVVANHGNDSISLLRGTGTNNLFATATNIALEPGTGPATITTTDINKDGHPDLVVANASLNTVDVLANQGHGAFAAAVSIPVGTQPTGIAVADVNADGKFDLTLANTGDTSVSVLFNNTVIAPSGRFVAASGSPVAVAGKPAFLVSADFNNDNKPDLAVTSQSSNGISLLLGLGDGRFQVPQLIAAGQRPLGVSVADFNRDGKPDLAFANGNDNTVSVLMGFGNGNFGPVQNFAVGQNPVSLISGDINTDGKPDLVVTNAIDNTVSLLLGLGDGNFQPALRFVTGQAPEDITMGDLNSDGKPDLAFTNQSDSTVGVLLGLGNGKFQPMQNFAVGNLPNGVAIGDINGDGKLDLGVANVGSNIMSDKTVSVLLGVGNGSFGPVQNFAVGQNPVLLAMEDINGDGKLDLAVTNQGDNNVSVLFNFGDGAFLSPQSFSVGQAPGDISLVDLNNDGRVDIMTANILDNSASVLMNRAP